MATPPRTRATFPLRAICHAGRSLLFTLAISTFTYAGETRPLPHRYVPAKNLIAYFEFDGLDAHAAAWKGTSAYAALNKTKAASMMRELAKQLGEYLIDENVPFLTSSDAGALYDHIMKYGFSVAVHNHGREAISEMFVLRDLGRDDLAVARKHFGRLARFGGLPEPTRLRGRTVYAISFDDEPDAEPNGKEPVSPLLRMKPTKNQGHRPTNAPWMTAWFDGPDLVVVWGPSEGAGDMADPEGGKTLAEIHREFITSVLDAADRKAPDVTTTACYRTTVGARNDLKRFESVGRFFVGPEHRENALMAFFDVVDAFSIFAPDSLTSAAEPIQKASPFRPPVEDRDVKKAGAESEPEPDPDTLPSVFPADVPKLSTPGRGADKPHGEIEPAPDAGPAEDDAGPFTPEEAEALGSNNLKCLAGRFGFQGEAFMSEVALEAPAPRKGINAFFDQPKFRIDNLPAMPVGTSTFAVGSLDLEKTYRALEVMSDGLDPSVMKDVHQFEEIVRDGFNLRLREDLLKQIGPAWCVYLATPEPGGLDRRNKSDLAAYVLLAQLKDAAAFAKVLEGIVSYVNESGGFLNLNQTPVLEKLPAPDLGYRLTAQGATMLDLGEQMRPTIMLGKSYLAVASTPELARGALAAEKEPIRRWQPTAELARAWEDLPRDLTFLLVSDHQDSQLPDGLAALPSIAQSLVNLSQETDLDHPSLWCLLDPLGVPRPGGFQVKIDPHQIPEANDLRPYLFPTVIAATIDEQGYRFINRSAFPGALIANEAAIKFGLGFGWTTTSGFWLNERVKLRFFDSDPDPALKLNFGLFAPASFEK